MDVPPVKPPALPAGERAPDADDGAGLPFASGQRAFARVIQVLGPDRAILDLAGQRLAIAPPIPLAPDQVLHVRVRGVSPVIDLELLEPPGRFSDRAYALAAVLHARQAAGPMARLNAGEVQTLLARLLAGRPDTAQGRASPDRPAAASLAEGVARWLAPVPVGAGEGGQSTALVDGLRHAVGAAARPLEARLAGCLASAAPADATSLLDDPRLMLARLQTETASEPEREQARAALAAEVQARQLDAVLHKVRDGELRLTVPMATEDRADEVTMRVRDEGAPAREGQRPAGRLVELVVDLPDIGRVKAAIKWSPGHVSTQFAVSGAAAHARLEPALPALVDRLLAVGFGYAAADVTIAPELLVDESAAGDDPLPGGSILEVRA